MKTKFPLLIFTMTTSVDILHHRLQKDPVSQIGPTRGLPAWQNEASKSTMDRNMRRDVTSIGLISDTHGLLRPEALRALEGSELIIHAGDVGKSEIIDTLKAIAPVFAVRGNVDTEYWASALPETEVVTTGTATIYVLHDVHALDLNPAAAGFHIVVSGHSHKPARTESGG